MAEIPLSEQQIAELKRAVEKLKSKRPAERVAAQDALDALGASKFDVLIALLRKEAADRRKRKRALLVGVVGYVALMALPIVVPLLFGAEPNTHFLNLGGPMTAVVAGALAVSAAQKNATQALAEFDDKRGVGWWALALEYNDKEIASLAQTKLIQLLPQLRASDRELMDDEQRGALYKALGKKPRTINHNAALIKAILKALEQIGDEKALPAVERLAKGEGLETLRDDYSLVRRHDGSHELARIDATDHDDIIAAARECLPALRERCELNRASESLLRASASTDVPGLAKGLLRPASHTTGAPQDELLRATAAAAEAVPAPTVDEVEQSTLQVGQQAEAAPASSVDTQTDSPARRVAPRAQVTTGRDEQTESISLTGAP